MESSAQQNISADPILTLVYAATLGLDWCRVSRANGTGAWITVASECSRLPRQGWKLHVSATRFSALEVLRRALSVLIAQQVTFKIAPLDLLDQLNHGRGGLSQIGKFITVYPENDEQAVRLAVTLDAATTGLRGPAIPSDRLLGSDSIVSYRYGSFDKRALQDADGLVLGAIDAPDGTLVLDPRLPTYVAPPWTVDPFVAAGVVALEQKAEPLLAQRYVLTGLLAHSARGAVYLAIDLHDHRACLIKQARRDALVTADGIDARDRLRNERDMLIRLAPYAALPQCYDLFTYREDLFLVMEHVRGETLGRHVRRLANAGRLLPFDKVLMWGGALAAALAAIHAQNGQRRGSVASDRSGIGH
jgi:hypothetical protein